MSIRMINLVWHSEMTDKEKLVMQALADYADDDGRSIHPSVDRMCWKTGIKKRTLQRRMRELEKKGWIQYVGTHPKYATRQYEILPENLIPKMDFWEWKEQQAKGCQNDTGDTGDMDGGDKTVPKGGDKAMTPDPSLIDPSLKNQSPKGDDEPDPPKKRSVKKYPDSFLSSKELRAACDGDDWTDWQKLVLTYQYLRRSTVIGDYGRINRAAKKAARNGTTPKRLYETYVAQKEAGEYWHGKVYPFENLIQQAHEDALLEQESTPQPTERSEWAKSKLRDYKERRDENSRRRVEA